MPGLGAARRQRAAAADGHRPPANRQSQPPAPSRCEPCRPEAVSLALCTFEAVLTGGIDAKVSTNVVGRPRRVLEWRAECGGYSEPEITARRGGRDRGEGGHVGIRYFLSAVAGLTASIPPR